MYLFSEPNTFKKMFDSEKVITVVRWERHSLRYYDMVHQTTNVNSGFFKFSVFEDAFCCRL